MKIREYEIEGIKLAELKSEPVKKISELSLQANAEGSVLLKNNGVLPLKKGDRVSVFGRMQADYYKSGTGSGGLVNVEYVTNIYDSLAKNKNIELNEKLAQIYREWVERHPFDNGDGWVQPWSQEEMPVSDETAREAAAVSDKAIVVIARTAGEERDNTPLSGSWLLTSTEYNMLKAVSRAFDRVCVVLNTSNIIDMKWVDELDIDAVLYVWQGGQDGGDAAADILCGKRTPSGKLSDTIAYNIEDYPSYDNFGSPKETVYTEDVFVGYRYFETFARDKVMYPFGYGFSYTSFDTNIDECRERGGEIILKATVTNTGDYSGKEVVQVYYGAESKSLSRPARELAVFAKTRELDPGESEELTLTFPVTDMAAYDDEGVTGNKSCYVLENGKYKIYAGTDVRGAAEVLSVEIEETRVIRRLSRLLAPDKSFDRMINVDGKIGYKTVCGNTSPVKYKKVKQIPQTGDRGIVLADVYNGKADMDAFIAQLSDFDLACLSQGEGMNSMKVRPGTGGAIGGITEELRAFGIPVICVTDGPSGLRFDNGDTASSMPSGTLLACTWNCDLVKRLYTYEGMEAYARRVDAPLGPGLNIHRIPLCGRNFEYFSEDPYLTGMIGKAICEGLERTGVTATIKHFAANNQEKGRHFVNSVVSERALREIYLKPFEMIVRAGKTKMLMTAYNRLNGTYCSANYELNTLLLRDEWGYDGLVMSDWCAKTCVMENGEASDIRAYPVKAQNDVYMVNADGAASARGIMSALADGELTIGELQRNAANICGIIMQTPTFERYLTDNRTDGNAEAGRDGNT